MSGYASDTLRTLRRPMPALLAHMQFHAYVWVPFLDGPFIHAFSHFGESLPSMPCMLVVAECISLAMSTSTRSHEVPVSSRRATSAKVLSNQCVLI